MKYDIEEFNTGKQYGPVNLMSLTQRVSNLLEDYNDIIRMSTSDRNKSKATINVLNKLTYQMTWLEQQLSAVLDDLIDVENLDCVSNSRLSGIMLSPYKENNFGIYNGLITPEKPAKPNHNAVIINKFAHILSNFMTMETYNGLLINSKDVIDLIVYGYTQTSQKNGMDIPNSKIVSQYINMIEERRVRLQNEGTQYIIDFLSNSEE